MQNCSDWLLLWKKDFYLSNYLLFFKRLCSARLTKGDNQVTDACFHGEAHMRRYVVTGARRLDRHFFIFTSSVSPASLPCH